MGRVGKLSLIRDVIKRPFFWGGKLRCSVAQVIINSVYSPSHRGSLSRDTTEGCVVILGGVACCSGAAEWRETAAERRKGRGAGTVHRG